MPICTRCNGSKLINNLICSECRGEGYFTESKTQKISSESQKFTETLFKGVNSYKFEHVVCGRCENGLLHLGDQYFICGECRGDGVVCNKV